MNKKALVIALLILVLLSFAILKNRMPNQTATSDKLSAGIDKKLAEWRPASYEPMNFGAYHVFASDNVFVRSNAEIDQKMLDALLETGADTIVLYIRPGSYFSQKERYGALISKIRNSGKKLFIGARFDDVKMDFSGYGNALENYTKSIIATVKPDYFGIVIEPMTMEQKYNFNATDGQWVALVDKIAKLSKQVSPSTKTVAGGHKGELAFLRLASDVKDVDILGFDIYSVEGIYPEYSGYLGEGDVVGDAIDYVNLKGKETWMLETWTSYISEKAMNENIDAKWIRLMVYYAEKHNMKGIVPFFTGKFVYYGTDPIEFKSALDRKQRTAAFYSYKSIIEEVRNNTKK